MDVKIIVTINLHQKYVNIFHQIFQCPEYLNLEEQIISMMYIEMKTVRKSFVSSKVSTQ